MNPANPSLRQIEYGKPMRGTLVILSDEMQWSYEVRGSHPHYVQPAAVRDPSRLLAGTTRNPRGATTSGSNVGATARFP